MQAAGLMGRRDWLCQMGLRPRAPKKLESAPRRHRPQHTSPRPSGTACPFQVSSPPVCNTEEPSGGGGRTKDTESLAGLGCRGCRGCRARGPSAVHLSHGLLCSHKPPHHPAPCSAVSWRRVGFSASEGERLCLAHHCDFRSS